MSRFSHGFGSVDGSNRVIVLGQSMVLHSGWVSVFGSTPKCISSFKLMGPIQDLKENRDLGDATKFD